MLNETLTWFFLGVAFVQGFVGGYAFGLLKGREEHDAVKTLPNQRTDD